MKKIISIITVILVFFIVSCVSEERMERTNRSQTSISMEQLAEDINFGTRYINVQRDLGLTNASSAAQYFEDWGYDNYLSYTGTPFDEEAGRDFMSFYMVEDWNNRPWNYWYDNVMSPAHANKKIAEEGGVPLFAAWAELHKIIAVSKLTLYYGPVIYSEYGDLSLKQFNYDGEQELYTQIFDNLDNIQKEFQTALDEGSTQMRAQFDAIYSGNLAKWLKFINTFRVQLAMRIVKADKDWALREYTKSMNDANGFILANADNFNSPLQGSTYPIYQMSEQWDDCRMGAEMEAVLVPLKDPRVRVWFNEITAASDITEFGLSGRDPGWRYKGIRRGGWIRNGKSERTPYSKVSQYFNRSASDGGTYRRILTAAQVHFIFAEATLRGWATPGGKTTKEWYESGIRMSWEDWDAPTIDGRTVEVYINDGTSMPMDYTDPRDATNSYETTMTDPRIYTVKWDDAVLTTNELKLEKIMFQKWIASFQHGSEMWADKRRTNYPAIIDPAKNMSSATWGSIPDGEELKRYVFVMFERDSNADGVAEATKKLTNGQNLVSTRLWIHPAGNNF